MERRRREDEKKAGGRDARKGKRASVPRFTLAKEAGSPPRPPKPRAVHPPGGARGPPRTRTPAPGGPGDWWRPLLLLRRVTRRGSLTTPPTPTPARRSFVRHGDWTKDLNNDMRSSIPCSPMHFFARMNLFTQDASLHTFTARFLQPGAQGRPRSTSPHVAQIQLAPIRSWMR